MAVGYFHITLDLAHPVAYYLLMTKKHFEAIARIIKSTNDEVPDGDLDDFDAGHQIAVEDIAAALARHFKSENPNFDPKRFLTSCGLPGLEVLFD